MFGQLPFDLMFLMMLYAAGTVMATIACLYLLLLLGIGLIIYMVREVTTTATERGIFGRYKHQTSDRGYRPRLCRLNKRKRQLHTASFLFTLSTELLRLPDTIGRSQK